MKTSPRFLTHGVVKGRFTVGGQEYKLHHLDISSNISSLRPHPNAPPLEDLFQRVLSSPDEWTLYQTVATAAGVLGFESFSYGCLYPRVEGPPVLQVCTPLSFDDWLDYHQGGLLECDEAVRHCRHSVVPTVWTIGDSNIATRSPAIAAKWAKRLATRLIFPVHGKYGEIAMFAFNSPDPGLAARFGNELFRTLAAGQLLAVHVHDQVSRITGLATAESNAQHESITDRELAVLGLVAKGNDNPAIATLLGITPRTVIFHLSNAMDKLGAKNRAEAAAKAVELGLVYARGLTTSDPGLADTTHTKIQAQTRPIRGRCYAEFPEFPILPFDPATFGFTEDFSSRTHPAQCPCFATPDGRYHLFVNWPAPEEREWYAPMTRFFVAERGPDDYSPRILFEAEEVAEILSHLRSGAYQPQPS